MAFIWIDKKDGEDLILASDINGIAKELINVEKDSAKKDLSNVDNETFKAKAEEAGVGGDAGLADEKNYMLFKDTADALPETANGLPFFNNLLDKNEYAGISDVKKQFNSYCRKHFNYHKWKDGSQWGINHWGGTGGGVVPGSKITDLKTTITHSDCTFHMYRMYVYDDNKNFEFKGNDGWWSCKKEGISI